MRLALCAILTSLVSTSVWAGGLPSPLGLKSCGGNAPPFEISDPVLYVSEQYGQPGAYYVDFFVGLAGNLRMPKDVKISVVVFDNGMNMIGSNGTHEPIKLTGITPDSGLFTGRGQMEPTISGMLPIEKFARNVLVNAEWAEGTKSACMFRPYSIAKDSPTRK